MILFFSRLILSVFTLGSICALGSPIINSSEEVEGALKALMNLNQNREEVLHKLQAHLQTSTSSLQEQISVNNEEQKAHQEQIKKLVYFMIDFYSSVSQETSEIAKQIARSEITNLFYLDILNEKIIDKDERRTHHNKHEITQEDIDVLTEFLEKTKDPEFKGRQLEDLTYKDFIIIMYRYLEYSEERLNILRKKRVPEDLLLKISYFKHSIQKMDYGMLSIVGFLDGIKMGSTIEKALSKAWTGYDDNNIYHAGNQQDTSDYSYSVRKIFDKIKSGELHLELSALDRINIELIEGSLHDKGEMLSNERLFQSIPYILMPETITRFVPVRSY